MAFSVESELSHADSLRLLDRQTAVLELLASGAPLPVVLTSVATALEGLIDGARCSILLLDQAAGTLYPAPRRRCRPATRGRSTG